MYMNIIYQIILILLYNCINGAEEIFASTTSDYDNYVSTADYHSNSSTRTSKIIDEQLFAPSPSAREKYDPRYSSYSVYQNSSKATKETIVVEGTSGRYMAEIIMKWKSQTIYHNLLNDTTPESDVGATNVGFLVSVSQQTSGRRLSAAQHIQPWAVSGALRDALRDVQPGRVVLVVLRVGFTDYPLSESSRSYLTSLGSVWAPLLGPRVAWHWVFIKGGVTLSEGLTIPYGPLINVAPEEQFHSKVILATPSPVLCPDWPTTSQWAARRRLCSSYEHYGALCSCDNPYTVPPDQQSLPSSLSQSVVVMIASRPTLLYRSLRAVFAAEGSSRSHLVVFTENTSKELVLLLKALEVQEVLTELRTQFYVTTISQLYSQAIGFVNDRMDDIHNIIFLEDDVEVSPDFFIYLNSTAPLLASDTTLYCISAHNDFSYRHTAYNATTLLRTESYPNYGWMAGMVFLKQLKSLLDSGQVKYDWDFAAYLNLRGNRECIIPEVSRSHHFGSSGLHMTQFEYHLQEFWQARNTQAAVRIPHQELDKLEPSAYERHIQQLFSKAIFLDPTHGNFCSEAIPLVSVLEASGPESNNLVPWVAAMLPTNTNASQLNSESILVFFFEHSGVEMKGKIYEIISMCFRVHCCDSREPHRGLHVIRMGRARLLLVAHPASPYSSHKPPLLPLLQASDALYSQASALRLSYIQRTQYIPRPLHEIWQQVALL